LSAGLYEWTDDSPNDYQFWALGEPQGSDPKNCVKLGHQEEFAWKDAECTEQLYFVCQYSKWGRGEGVVWEEEGGREGGERRE
jgi:hypothetical protein